MWPQTKAEYVMSVCLPQTSPLAQVVSAMFPVNLLNWIGPVRDSSSKVAFILAWLYGYGPIWKTDDHQVLKELS